MASCVLFPMEQLWKESGFLLLHPEHHQELLCGQGLPWEATECPGLRSWSLLVSKEKTSEYKSSALFWVSIYNAGVELFRKALQHLHRLSFKFQCWFLSCKWSCFPIFFLILCTRLLSMSANINLKHTLYGVQHAYWKERILCNEKG